MILQIDEHYVPACGGGCSGSSATSCGLTCSSSHTPGGQPQQAAAVGCSACHTPPSNASTALAGSTSSPGALTSSSLGHQRSDSSDGEFDPGLLEEGWQSDASSDNFLEIEEDSGGTEVVAVKEGVAVWPTKDARIMGRLSLVKQHNVLFLAWLPYATPAKPTTAAAGAAGRHSSAINSKGCVGGTGMGPAPQAPASQQQQYVGASSAAAAVAAGLGCGAAAAPGGCSNTSCGGPGAAGGGAEARDWLYKDAQGWQQPPAPSSSPRQAGGCASKATAAGGAAEAAACAPAACSCCWAGRGLPAGGSSCGCSCHSAGSRAAAEVGGGGWQQPTMAPGVRGNSSSSGGGSPTAAAAGVQGCGSSLPLAAATTAPGSSGSSGHVAVSHPGSEASMYAIHPFPLSDVIAITKHTPPLGWHHLVFVLVSGLTLPPLYFHQGGAQGLLKVLQQHVSLVPCARQPNTYLVNDTADPLRRSLTSLDLSDILLGAPQPGASLAAEPEEGPLAHGGWREPPPPVELAWRGLGQQLGETLSWVTSLARESASVLVSAAVDTWHADVLRPFDHDEDPEGASSGSSSGGSSPPAGLPGHWWGSQAGGQLPVLGTNTAVAAAAAAAGGRTSRRSLCDIQQQQQQQQGGCASSAAPACTNSTACITAAAAAAAAAPLPIPQGARSSGSTTSAAAGTLWSDGVTPGNAGDGDPTPDTPLGSFEMVEGVGEEEGGLLARHHRARPPPLSREEFATYFTPEGVLADEAGFRERVYTSGMDPELRPEAWPLLLGVFPAGSTAAERAAAAEEQAGRYQALKAQWRSIGREQARKNRAFRERKGRVEKDVRRTDRCQPFYRGPAAEARLVAMRDVLLTYAMYNFDLGYCQGMSDLLSPLLVVAGGDEAAAYALFSALMARLEPNFSADAAGNAMGAQLAALRRLVQVLDPQLHAFFEARDCLNYFFAFRWLLIHFKREFDFDRVPRLWEALWACPLTRHLHLYLAAAVLVHHRRAILGCPDMGFDGMLKFAVELSGKLDMNVLLRTAEVLVRYAGAAGAEICAGLP